ncbi:calcium-binding protein, partial [Gymnodinialimonas ulvae]|uniref:calcium-binding protein n=1 Tax=Gymnodinialimonas ulvae TaxID=3126504 RepID=UPI00309796EC
IGVEGANGVLVEGNTLLWNQDAVTIKADGDTSFAPRIRLEGVSDGTISQNITTRILSDEANILDGNEIISYDPADPNYVGDHFVNAANGGDIGPNGWQLLPGSTLIGAGASASQPGALTTDDGGVQPEPDPQPEPVPEPVSPAGDDHLVSSLWLDFEGNMNGAPIDSDIVHGFDSDSIVNLSGSNYYQIRDSSPLTIDLQIEQDTQLDGFKFSMDLFLSDAGRNGRLVSVSEIFEAKVNSNGAIALQFWTSDGSYSVRSEPNTVVGGSVRSLSFEYQENLGLFTMHSDGNIVASVVATGSIALNDGDLLTIGSAFGNVVEALVDNVSLTFAAHDDPLGDAGTPVAPEETDPSSPGAGGSPADAYVQIIGSADDDLEFGFDSPDFMEGFGGNDVLIGEGGDDHVVGGDGDDTLLGSGGNDSLNGGDGSDVIDGGDGADSAYGGAGADTILGYDGDDGLEGGAGNDFIVGGDGADLIGGDLGDDLLHGQNGDDLLVGGVGNDTLFGENGADVMDGGAGADLLIGGANNDLLDGGSGADELIGGWGSDTLSGGEGNDTLNSGAGADNLIGGLGDDAFYFDSFDGQLDQVTDFTVGADKLVFNQNGFDGQYQGIELMPYANGSATVVRFLDDLNIVDTSLGGIVLAEVEYGTFGQSDYIEFF